MPDWIRHVRDRLSLPALDERREDELIQDIAQQLDDIYRDALGRGTSEDEAAAEAGGHIRDWHALARDLTDANAGRRKPHIDQWQQHCEAAFVGRQAHQYRIGGWFDQVRLDSLYGLRQLLTHRGFTCVAVLTLALGIGMNTAMFSVVRSLLTGASRFPDADRLVMVHATTADGRSAVVTDADYEELSRRRGLFSLVAMFDTIERTLGAVDDPLTVRVVSCSADFPALVGVRPLLGRRPGPTEYLPGADPVVLITERLWRRTFASDPGVVGRSITIDAVAHAIVGVLPESDSLDRLVYAPFDVLAPMGTVRAAGSDTPPTRRTIARLAAGATLDRARAELARVVSADPPIDLTAKSPKTFGLRSLDEALVPFSRRIMSAALLATVALLLVMACLNLASMLMARTSAREREFAIRAALGAGRGRILRQLMTESLMLAAAGGLLGVLVGAGVLRLVRIVGDAPLYVQEAARIDAALFGYAFLLCLITALVFGLTPAALTAKALGGATLRQGTGALTTPRARGRLRSALVIAELAIGVPLLVAMSLVLRHLDSLRSADRGFQVDRLVTMRVDLPAFRYDSDAKRTVFVRDAVDRLRAMPAIASVGASSGFPIGVGGYKAAPARISGSSTASDAQPESLAYKIVTPGYFDALGVALLLGRHVSDQDTAVSEGVAVVNRRLADRYWPGGDPIGRTIVMDPDGKNQRQVTVVGVVADFGREWEGSLPDPQLYVPHQQQPASRMVVVARTVGDPANVAAAMRQAVRHLDAEVPVSDVLTATEITRRWLRDDEIMAWFLSAMAALALSLSVIGLYGLMSQLVIQRKREIGVRLALGATPGDVGRMMLLRSSRLAATGLVIGAFVSVPVGLAMSNQLYGVAGTEPRSFALVAVLLLAAGVLAGYLPARRAARIDPTATLRCE